MPKIKIQANLSNLTDPKEFQRHASIAVGSAVDAMNGKLEFDKNMNTQTVEVTFPTANTDVAVPHSLNRVGVKYLKGKASADCSIYDGVTTGTTNILYLRSTRPATVSLVLF